MKEWYLINPQPTFNSGYETEEFDNYSSDGFNELLDETPLGKDIFFCRGQFDGERFEEEVEMRGIVQSETPDAYTQGWQRQLLTRIADKVQDYKYIRYDGSIWLIMNIPCDNSIYNKCILHMCNYTLKWQDETGRIYYYPTHILDSTQYNTGIEDNRSVVQTGYIQLNAWVSLDEVTAELQRDKRMFIDVGKKHPDTYVVTSTSKIPYSYNEMRVMRITFTECEFNPDTDRTDLMLCNYIKNNSSDTQDIEILYRGIADIRIGGYKSFKVDSETAVKFELLLSEMQSGEIDISQDNNSCKIKVKNNSAIVGTSFKLKATDTDGKTGEILIDVIGGV